MREMKVLGDKKSYTFWEEKLKEIDETIKKRNDSSNNNDLNKEENNTKAPSDWKSYYQSLMEKIVNRRNIQSREKLSESEKKELIGQIFNDFLYMESKLESMDDIIELIDMAKKDFDQSDNFEKKFFNDIIKSSKEKINEFNSWRNQYDKMVSILKSFEEKGKDYVPTEEEKKRINIIIKNIGNGLTSNQDIQDLISQIVLNDTDIYSTSYSKEVIKEIEKNINESRKRIMSSVQNKKAADKENQKKDNSDSKKIILRFDYLNQDLKKFERRMESVLKARKIDENMILELKHQHAKLLDETDYLRVFVRDDELKHKLKKIIDYLDEQEKIIKKYYNFITDYSERNR